MLEEGQASSEDIIELSDDAIADMQSMLEDMDMSIIELDEVWASEGNAAEAIAPAMRRAPATRISFFI